MPSPKRYQNQKYRGTIQVNLSKEEKERTGLKDDTIQLCDDDEFFILLWSDDNIVSYVCHSMSTDRLKEWVKKHLK